MPRPRSPIDAENVIRMYQAGRSLQEIARELGVDRSRVTRVVKEAGIFQDRRGAHWREKRLRKRQWQVEGCTD